MSSKSPQISKKNTFLHTVGVHHSGLANRVNILLFGTKGLHHSKKCDVSLLCARVLIPFQCKSRFLAEKTDHLLFHAAKTNRENTRNQICQHYDLACTAGSGCISLLLPRSPKLSN